MTKHIIDKYNALKALGKQRLHDLERENEEFKKENDIMNKFIKALGSQYEDMFKDFCKKER